MNQDVNPNITKTQPEPLGFPAPAKARLTLETPPDNEFDALTDLFIGDGVMSPLGTSDGESESTVLRYTNDDEPQLSSVEPVALEVHDDVVTTASIAGEARVTALVLGHLPVFASAWANQYARHLASCSGGVVAVLRIRGGYAAVDLVGEHLSDLQPKVQADVESAETIEDAIQIAGRVTNQWVLRVGEPDEPMLANCDAVDELTLLTGIDEAAVVASYQTLKRLRQGAETGPEITLAVMAATEEQARPIAHKISRATETFLERPARVICCVEKITGGPSIHVFGGDTATSLETALDLIQRAGEHQDEATVATTELRFEDSISMAEVASSIEMTPNSDWPSEQGLPETDEIASEMVSEMMGEPMVGVALMVDDAASSETVPSGSHRTADSLDLFEAIAATCPYAACVRLAMDSRGSLQLIGDADASVEEQIVQLVTVSSWAWDHRALLKLTEPRLCVEPRPVQHVLTREPSSVRRLLDSEIRVHLCVDVPDGERVYVSLNHG